MGRFAFGFTIGLLVLCLALVAFSGSGAGASGPSITVSVNGEEIADGERVVVPEANISVSVTGDVAIQTVVVREDGEDIYEADTDGTSHEVHLDPDLGARLNVIKVIVKDENGNLSTYRSTIYKDSLAPDIGLTEPFNVDAGHRFPGSKISTSANMTVNGTVEDATEITSFSAKIVGGGQSVETQSLEKGSFQIETSLVIGNNSLIISAEDEYGNRAHRSARLTVSDEGNPELAVRNWPTETETATVRPTIIATDDVAVQTVRYRIPGQPAVTAVEPRTKLLDANRMNVTREIPLTFHRPGTYNVTFNVSDAAGKYSEVTETVTYDPVTEAERVEPNFQLRDNRSGIYNNSVYRLNGTVENGSVQWVFVEATNRFGQTNLFETIYDGPNVSTVPIEIDVPIDTGRNEIRIEVRDALGNSHEYGHRVDTANASAYERPNSAPETTVQETTAPNPTQTTVKPENTRISVIEPTPIEPATETSSPLSPLLSLLAVVIAGGIGIARGID